MDNNVDKGDLETVHSYFVTCCECSEFSAACEDWVLALDVAKQDGFQIEDGVVYCKECAELELQRQAEDAEEVSA